MSECVKRPVIRPFLQKQSGFSFVELVTVIILIGILSTVAIARFSSSDGFAEFTYQNRLISALRNIQQRAMQDNRSAICYQINLVSGASTPAFGPPTTDYSLANQANTCASGIDTSTEFLATTSGEIAQERVSLNAFDGANATLSYLRFDRLGRPITNIANCSTNCQVDFVGERTASVCVSSQGYIYAC